MYKNIYKHLHAFILKLFSLKSSTGKPNMLGKTINLYRKRNIISVCVEVVGYWRVFETTKVYIQIV